MRTSSERRAVASGARRWLRLRTVSFCLLTLSAALSVVAQESATPAPIDESDIAEPPELGKREVEKEPWSRGGKIEIYAFPYYLSGDTAEFSGLGDIEFDSTLGGGLGFGGNLGQHFNLNTELSFARTDLDVRYENGLSGTGDSNLFGWNLNLDYNILKGRLTPFITGSVGIYAFSGDMTAQSTADFSEVDLSYGGGVGLRWDVSNHFFLKALYRPTWTSLEGSDNTMLFQTAELSVGLIF